MLWARRARRGRTPPWRSIRIASGECGRATRRKRTGPRIPARSSGPGCLSRRATGKDRPVLVVAVESAGTYLAVQLTSKDHDGEGDFVPVGAGGWDGEHRPSWVNLDRVIRVHEGGMRREAAALPRAPFERVTDRVHH